MAKRKRRYTAKTKGRMLVIFLFFGAIIGTLGYTLVENLGRIYALKVEKRELIEEKSDLEDDEEAILADIKKLSDPSYVARYAREKYFYSKEGEIILRILE